METASPPGQSNDSVEDRTAAQRYMIQVNGVLHDVKNEDPLMSLAEYLRSVLHLCGTKTMCHEGGCGCCVVVLEYDNPTKPEKRIIKSMNSCLFPIGSLLSLKNHQVVTIEALGSMKKGLHPIQQRLADYNGSQCGFCSPGFVMQMFGLLKNKPSPSFQDVEDNFDGNVCRCTGYRSILDAMKSFVKSTDTKLRGSFIDIEDLMSCTKIRRPCTRSSLGEIASSTSPAEGTTSMLFSKDGLKWYQPTELTQLYLLMQEHSSETVKLVHGDTAKGVYKKDGPYQVLIDVKGIPDLYKVTMGPNGLKVFSNVTLSSLIGYLKQYSDQSLSYNVIARHLLKVANGPVRNAGGWAGNLMMKWKHHEFVSDVFVAFEVAGAKLTVGDIAELNTYTPAQFLDVNMNGKVLLCVEIPKLAESERMNSYKIMPRMQNAHTYVSAGFRVQLKALDKKQLVESISMVYTGINETFIHAVATEKYLQGKDITANATLQGALTTLDKEIIPDEDNPLLASAEYRKSLALGLFYKFFLSLLSEGVVSPCNRSATCSLERPVSTGKQTFSSKPEEYPLTKPMPKLSAYKQTSGEAEFINDLLPLPNELFAMFVLSTEGSATISNIDSTAAMSVPGAAAVLKASDIPGCNTFMPPPYEAEEILSSGPVLYAGQPIALCLADSQHHALEMVEVVKVTYQDQQPPIVTLDEAIEKKSFYPSPGKGLLVGHPEDAISESPCKIEGEVRAGEQYHFHMETQICRCMPTEDGLDVQAASQWLDLAQQAIACAIGIPATDINISAKRLGGAYGGKATRASLVACGAAVAATVLCRPVRCIMDLSTNMKAVGKRHSYIFKYKVGFNEDGKLNGIIITYYADNGCSPNDNEVGESLVFSDNVYKCQNWKLIPVALKTNRAAHTWCRAPGSVPNIFVIETILEHVAKFLNLDPIAVKQKNLYVQGDITPLGFNLPYCSIWDLYSTQLEKVDVAGRLQAIKKFNADNRWKKKGLAVVPLKYGLYWSESYYLCTVSIFASDGSVMISQGGIESGQGLDTKVAQVCAYALGIPVNSISIKPTTTISSPNSGPTGGSMTSELNCLGVKNCCEILKKRMDPVKDTLPPGTPWKDLVAACFKAKVNLTAQYWVWPDAQPKRAPQYNSYGVTVAEADLDVLTGENQISQVDILFDCGESMNPDIDIGQVEGAFVMGMGYWLLEKMIYDPSTGEVLNPGTWDYKPPFSKSIPINFNIELLKNAPNPMGVLRSKASGEPPQCMSCVTLFAVKHAIEAARQDVGKDTYFPLSGPATVDVIQASCLVDYKHFSI
ncbi:xanthine dehydrogenase-like isoform X1 [Chiloscyllium plagiosum]|uniref:xanthine dehydrogenase-like isoform X1 n=2 Tax=Chiloscyllium plagiosum TaxID=36176 RepID=UPI001CB85D27|nr:xanthine dehydrogenase-like isoform X1 [Chiloscyllium plagiosum]XP_043564210.1 xanthine dehydrogenase-like isoform X1 [Chiloscyllium plagiosum]